MAGAGMTAGCPHGRASWASCPHCLGINRAPRPSLTPQPGPCIGCGAENYPLSTGGPSICPACDCMPAEGRVKDLAAENRRLRQALEAATAQHQPPDWEREFLAAQAFLAASVAVWREIDRLDAAPEGYHPVRMSVDLRKAERAAWERYRDLLPESGT